MGLIRAEASPCSLSCISLLEKITGGSEEDRGGRKEDRTGEKEEEDVGKGMEGKRGGEGKGRKGY